MANKQLTLPILWLLIASSCQLILGQTEPDAQQLQALRPRGRIRIADMQMPQPPLPPPPPMPGHGPMNWPGYGAVAPMPATSTVHTHIPLLREEQLDNNAANLAMPTEAVVYGNWKPDHHPLRPNGEEAQPKQRVYGRLEAMLMGLPADANERRDSSSEEHSSETERRTASGGYQNPLTRRDSFERSQESRGRWRIPPGNIHMQPSETPIEVVHMNASDPLMRAMAKQINQSIEATTAHRQTTEDSWMPLPYPYPTPSYESTQPVPRVMAKVSSTPAPTLSSSLATEFTTVALNWPTDFLDAASSSTERIYTDASSGSIDRIDRVDRVDSIDRIDEDVDDYKYYEESLNSAQMHSELSVPDTLLPQLPLNITRVGIPYEERNSAEEPKICVPLTVTETAAESTSALLVEVERVYCFPLPKVEIKTGNIRQQQLPQPTQHEHSSGASITSTTTEEQPQPALSAAAGRQSCLTLLLIIWSSVWAYL
ncbi:uncharacterized protein Dvir_GJ20035 [Drosophila virilis]|uniref:Flocculation protein FLO11 n=1 Tax=Drosophila virilis TaxID=7244 RepID=B4LLS5_DROVI|nr:flocculation protein FLO11 [Drosophila virilis]EDW61948.1 uncharacterized protein Dvir_GJ20035 [Drosophila virilis]